MISFKTQFDKLVTAYLQNKVKPWDPCACFVGNLLNGAHEWRSVRTKPLAIPGFPNIIDLGLHQSIDEGVVCIIKEGQGTYTCAEIEELEDTFMSVIMTGDPTETKEDLLFEAFEKALFKLKKIHESKGEIVESFVFTKRVLEPA